MKEIIFVIAVFIMVSGCQTQKQIERIVVTDTTRIVLIDTTHIRIIDTLQIVNTINVKVFDTLYNYVDTVVVREVIGSVNTGIRTTFRYDTLFALKNKIISLKLNYDGEKLFIDMNEKQLLDSIVIREKAQEIKIEESKFPFWVQILMGAVVFLLIILGVAWRLSKK